MQRLVDWNTTCSVGLALQHWCECVFAYVAFITCDISIVETVLNRDIAAHIDLISATNTLQHLPVSNESLVTVIVFFLTDLKFQLNQLASRMFCTM